MRKYVSRKRVVGAKGPILPSSYVVGRFLNEDGNKVWERFVTDRHLLRMLDSYTINAGILDQLLEHRVDRIRYVTTRGTYEIPLRDFISQSKLLRGFANGENVHALARSAWSYRPIWEDAPLLSGLAS